MKIRAILFDLDDTLVVDEAVSREAFQAVAAKAHQEHAIESGRFLRAAEAEARRQWASGPCVAYCREIGISAFECLWGRFEGETPELTALRAWAQVFRRRVFDAALREQMIEDPKGGADLARAFEEARRRLQRLMPDAVETLARLRPDYRIGLLTNGAPDLQREKIAASGLGKYFHAIVISGERGIGKPRPEIFQRLLTELGVDAAESVMVGNSLERDIAGARNAGVTPIWIRVPGSEEFAEAVPAETITGLAQLPGALQAL